MYPAEGLRRKLMQALKAKPAVIVDAGLVVLAGVWLSRLAPYLYYLLLLTHILIVKLKTLSAILFLVGVALGALGAFWVYPLIPSILIVLLYAYEAPQYIIEESSLNIAISIALMVAMTFARRLTSMRAVSIPHKGVSWLLGLPIVLGIFIGLPLLLKVIVMDGIEALLKAVHSFPYTLREFYTVVTETRVGLGVFVAIVVAVAVRVVVWVSSPLLEGLTASPRSSLKEINDMVKRDLYSILHSRPEASKWISIGVSTAISLAILPLLGWLGSIIRGELTGLPEGYSRLAGALIPMVVYAILWEALRKVSHRLSPSTLARDAAMHPKWRGLAQVDVLKEATATLARRALLGIAVALVVLVALNLVMLAIGGQVSLGSLLNVTARGLAGEGEPYSAVIEKYARAYSLYLSSYIENLDKLFAIVIRLLWGG